MSKKAKSPPITSLNAIFDFYPTDIRVGLYDVAEFYPVFLFYLGNEKIRPKRRIAGGKTTNKITAATVDAFYLPPHVHSRAALVGDEVFFGGEYLFFVDDSGDVLYNVPCAVDYGGKIRVF